MNHNTITVEIDERPLSLIPPTDADYISRQICGALYRTLFRWDSNIGSALPNIVDEWNKSNDNLIWTFHLAGDVYWSNGQRLSSLDVLRGIYSASHHTLWSRYTRIIEKIEITEEKLVKVHLRTPFDPFLALLSTVDFSPRSNPIVKDSVFSGPYCLDAVNSGKKYCLVPNQVEFGYENRSILQFIVNREPEASIHGFMNGSFDVTSNTGFPLRTLNAWRNRKEYRCGDTGIVMQLEPNPWGPDWLKHESVRQALFLALDRIEIAYHLLNGLMPSNHFGPRTFPILGELAIPKCDRDRARYLIRNSECSPALIRIQFNEYHPNREVLEYISAQWFDVLGIQTELISVDFCKPNCVDFDFLFALRFPTFPSEWAIVEHLAILAAAVKAEKAQELWRWTVAWRNEGQQAVAMCRMSELLWETCPVIPLFDVLGHWLERPSVGGYNYPSNGCFDYNIVCR